MARRDDTRRTFPAPARPAPAPDTERVLHSLRRLFQGLRDQSKAMQRDSGLSLPQASALGALAAEPGLSLGALARRLCAHPSTVSGIVERLVARGAVRREVNAEDRRGIRLQLTARGRALLRASPPPEQAGLRRALEGMSPARLQLLRTSLDEIARAASPGSRRPGRG